MVRKWYQAGYIQKDVLSVKSAEADLKAGKYASGIPGNLAYEGNVVKSVKAGNGYDVYEIPFTKPVFTTNGATATVTSVAGVSQNPEKAVQLLELVNNDKELFNLLSYGVENVHYTKINDNKISYAQNSKFKHGNNWVIGNTFNGYVVDPEPDNKNEMVLETHKNAVTSALIGFVFNTENVKSEVAQCKTVADEMLAAIVTGTIDYQTLLPDFISKLEKAGSAKIIAEMQRQIDQHLTKK